jgi:electron-transferring-flavoprotein dehydrogenase
MASFHYSKSSFLSLKHHLLHKPSWSSSSLSYLSPKLSVFHQQRPPMIISRSLTNATTGDIPPREVMDFDVVIVGAGPAGLSTAIRLKQLANQQNKQVSVCVVEKGSEVGAHILSGNVFNPRALNELFPDWKSKGALGDDPTPAGKDYFKLLTSPTGSINIPEFIIPPPLHNHGNYIISLSQLVRWLGNQATELGVDIFPGFPASEVLYDQNKEGKRIVVGIATRDQGIGKNGKKKDSFTRGMELRAKQTIFAEGARGSCSEEIIKTFNLRAQSMDDQSYGLGVKEVWEIPQSQHHPGLVQHTAGWPLDSQTYGGSFLYHMKPNLVLIGFVVGLDYKNPYLSPYQEFQRFKHHPEIAKHLQNGSCIAYGARVINEGGYQAIPKLTFPGGALVGCSAGFLNIAAIKGSHTAMKSGIECAEALITDGGLDKEPGTEIIQYENRMKKSWVYDELYKTRNFAPGFKYGLYGGTLISGIVTHVTRGMEPFTLSKHPKGFRDADATKPAEQMKPIQYPKPDGILSFDLLTNLQKSGTNHEEDQPSHLRIKPELKSVADYESLAKFAGPEQRFCPAKVYEYVDSKLVINAQNCIHCKACSIKTTKEFIQWTVPEGGGGPAYSVM